MMFGHVLQLPIGILTVCFFVHQGSFGWTPKIHQPRAGHKLGTLQRVQTSMAGTSTQSAPHEMTDTHDKSLLNTHVSLAGDCSVAISTKSPYTWSLYAIDEVVAGENIIADGAKAMRALAISRTTTVDPLATISCHLVKTDSLLFESTMTSNTNTVDNQLSDLLQKIHFQWVIKTNPLISNLENQCRISFHQEDSTILDLDMSSKSWLESLFSGLVDMSTPIEWVEMVTNDGVVLGQVPRRLVHKFNLLHRGIGLFVTKDKPIQVNDGDFPSLYVHRRSPQKKIFPSLYDMFVGGVSLADEPSEVTARREVAEELGLTRALQNDEKALLGPILTCTVCTAYNRCVVTLFSYTMNSDQEIVTWQEEEVDWGSFIPYPVILAAADRSIQRFATKQCWPGTYPPFQSSCKGTLAADTVFKDDAWTEWDFVPDGLLVWEAWLKFVQGQTD